MALKKKSSREIVKGFSWVYLIYAILTLLVLAGCFLTPGLQEAVNKAAIETKLGIKNPMMILEIGLGIQTCIYLICFYLARKVGSGESNGTVLMVLLIISVTYSFLKILISPTKATGLFESSVNAALLYFLFKVRKEK